MGKAARQRQQQARETGSGPAAGVSPPADALVVPIPGPAMAQLAALWVAKQRADADMQRAFNLVLLTLGEDPAAGTWSMDTDACTATRRPVQATAAAQDRTPLPQQSEQAETGEDVPATAPAGSAVGA